MFLKRVFFYLDIFSFFYIQFVNKRLEIYEIPEIELVMFVVFKSFFIKFLYSACNWNIRNVSTSWAWKLKSFFIFFFNFWYSGSYKDTQNLSNRWVRCTPMCFHQMFEPHSATKTLRFHQLTEFVLLKSTFIKFLVLSLQVNRTQFIN